MRILKLNDRRRHILHESCFKNSNLDVDYITLRESRELMPFYCRIGVACHNSILVFKLKGAVLVILAMIQD